MGNILILGGSGFLSGTLAETARDEGHEVWVVTRGNKPVPSGLHHIQADRKEKSDFKKAMTQVSLHWDLAVDCIAFEADDLKQDIDVLEALADHLVFISTDFVYEPLSRHFPQSESPAVYNKDDYGGGKRAGEEVLLNYGDGPLKWTIFRPGHIYGPGSKLGCLPLHGRDSELIKKILAGETLTLVGGGHFLQQPIFAPDLARLILSVLGNEKSHGQIFNAAGPEIVPSRKYYEYIGKALIREIVIEEISVEKYARENPDRANFLCHRFYNLDKLREARLTAPSTPLEKGLAAQVKSLMEDNYEK
jgi:nucleoside-diphosphate-sugar epimerase